MSAETIDSMPECACTDQRAPKSMTACPTCFHMQHPAHLVCGVQLVLAASEVPSGLDVERLARAMRNINNAGLHPGRMYPTLARLHEAAAAADLAAEYARLTATPEANE